MPSKKNKSSDDITIHEAASKLDVSDATARKYLKDFDIGKAKGFGGKAVITAEMFNVLSEVVKLRGNGLSIQEIKDLMSQEPSKVAAEVVEKAAVITDTQSNERTFDASDILDELKQKEEGSDDAVDIDEEMKPEDTEDGKQETPAEGKSDDEDPEELEENEEGDGTTEIRKRLFNYRYVERQISNDSKKINWFRQRLRNPNISLQDKMLFEEALERRILFLDGWKHILRYVSCK